MLYGVLKPEVLKPEYAHKIAGGVITDYNNDVCLACGKKVGSHTGSDGELICWGEPKPQPKSQPIPKGNCPCNTGSSYGPHSANSKPMFVSVQSGFANIGICAAHAQFYEKHGQHIEAIVLPTENVPVPKTYDEHTALIYGRNFPGASDNHWPENETLCLACGGDWSSHSGPYCSYIEYNAVHEFYKILNDKDSGHAAQHTEPTPYLPGESRRTKSIHTARTQKAKGLYALKDDSNRNTVPYELIDASKALPEDLINKFVRPCPMRPRHGFVDSRFIENSEQASQIIKETLSADADAELVLARKVNAEFSGIWTKGYLTVGKGTDGATAGHSAKMIPVLGTLTSDTLNNAADIKNAPYLELLFKSNEYASMQREAWQVYEVQLRDGPELPTLSEDYIPAETTVSSVALADGDLLEWESKVKTFDSGTVVYHPNGSMASHYAIHAVLAKIPVLITREPQIGEVLQPNQKTAREPNIQDFMAGYSFGVLGELTMKDAGFAMLAGLHHTSIWLGRHDILLGLALGCAWRLTVTAGLGEARHARSNSPRQLRKKKCSRDSVYEDVWNKTDKPAVRRKFRQAVEGFLTRNYESGFGGESWYRFTQWAVKMHNALLAGDIKASLNYLNQLVHSAHNNGWGFDKFLTSDDLTRTARNPVYAALRCAVSLYRASTLDSLVRANMAEGFSRYRRPLADTQIIAGGKRIDANGNLLNPDGDDYEENEENEEEEYIPEPMPNYAELPVTVVQVKYYPATSSKAALHVQVGHDGTAKYEKLDLSVKWTLEEFTELTKGMPQVPSLSGAETKYVVVPHLPVFGWRIADVLVYAVGKSIAELQQAAYAATLQTAEGI